MWIDANDAIAKNIASKSFAGFRRGYFDMEDTEYSNRAAAVKDEQIEILIKDNPINKIRNIAEIFPMSQMSFVICLKTLEYVNIYDVCVIHDLKKKILKCIPNMILCSGERKRLIVEKNNDGRGKMVGL